MDILHPLSETAAKTKIILTACWSATPKVLKTLIKKGTAGVAKAALNSITEIIGQKAIKEKNIKTIKKTFVIGSKSFPEIVTLLR